MIPAFRRILAWTCSIVCVLATLDGGGGELRAQEVTLPDDATWRSEYRARRGRLLERLAAESEGRVVLFLRAREPAVRSNDVHYPYRGDSDLFYLTGLNDDGVALLLSTRAVDGAGREVLFVEPPRPWEDLWVGKGLDAAAASEVSGIDAGAVLALDRAPEILRHALGVASARRHLSTGPGNLPVLVFDADRGFAAGAAVTEPYGFLVATLGSAAFHLELRSAHRAIAPLRQVKSEAEVAAIEKAIRDTCAAHVAAMRLARPGLREAAVAAEIEATFRRQGSSGWAFPSIVGSGPNSCILHYERYERVVEDGDLIVMDIGAEYGLYAADVTRTIPASGRFTPRQRQIYEIVLEAQEAAFAAIRPGVRFGDVQRAGRDVVARRLVEIGLIEKPAEVGKYLPHGISHGLGLDVHDAMPEPELAVGMVFTVEPGVYIPEENLGIRIEDDVVVTEDGCRILSLGAPRTVDDVERAMRTAEF